MKSIASTPTDAQAWMTRLNGELDQLELQLLQGDALAVQTVCARVQSTLQTGPAAAQWQSASADLIAQAQQAALRFGRLRQGVLRAVAQNQRALQALMPEALQTPTYDRRGGVRGPAGPTSRPDTAQGR